MKFSSEINAGHLLTAASLLLSVFVGWSNLDKRVAVNEQNIQSVKEMAESNFETFKADLARIESKLDRLIEREN